MTDPRFDPEHPLRTWEREPIPRREEPARAALERLAQAAQLLAEELRAICERIPN